MPTVECRWTTFTLEDGRVTWRASVVVHSPAVALELLRRREEWLRRELANTVAVREALDAE